MNQESGLKEIFKQTLFGKPRNIKDPNLFHKLALIPILAWIGLGADGLSSSSYGPEEAFKTLGSHTYLALFLALATAMTVLIISTAYSRIIEYFPTGGGGYVVATHTLGEKAGLISGSALLVDYILTITVSIVSCGDAIFSFFPLSAQSYKIPFDICAIILLVILNLRGVKESVQFLTPIFIVFVMTHLFMIGYGILSHIPQIGAVSAKIGGDFKIGLSTLGAGGMILLFLKAFSMGGGPYTGI
jgi:amino acid transporter